MVTKPKLVIIPGWDGTRETWLKFAEIAGQNFDVEVIELPCFGNQKCPDEVWGVEQYSNFVKDKILRYKKQDTNVSLLGHSFGGQVAVYLISNNDNLVDKLILSGAAVFRPKKTLKKALFGILAKSGKIVFRLPILKKFDKLVKKVLYRAAQSPDYTNTSGIKREIFKKVTSQDVSDLLPKITVPTLVVWGDKDVYVPLAHGEKIAGLIPNAKFEVIKDGTHGLHIKNSEKLFEIIKNFCG